MKNSNNTIIILQKWFWPCRLLEIVSDSPGLPRAQFKVSWYRLLSPNIKILDLVFSIYIMTTTLWIIKHKPLNYKKEEVQTCLHLFSTSIHVCLQGIVYFQEYQNFMGPWYEVTNNISKRLSWTSTPNLLAPIILFRTLRYK